ncbi:MAG TPA: SRPBCC family protein [Candidatus Acidoferrum sp.]|nr:SRPBCC family protein [Candidatus Acidoferrum sp.]
MSEQFVFRSRMPASADSVYRFHAGPQALTQLTPPWENATVYEQSGGIADLGSRVKIRLKIGPLSQTWVAEHTACEPGRMFRDTMVSGPFKKWEHTHLFEPDGADASWLEDRVDYEMPLGWLGKTFGGWYARKRLERMFAWRHATTARAVTGDALARAERVTEDQ